MGKRPSSQLSHHHFKRRVVKSSTSKTSCACLYNPRSMCTCLVWNSQKLPCCRLLGTFFIDWCIHGIVPTEWRVIAWQSRLRPVITTKTAIISIYADINVLGCSMESSYDAVCDEHHLYWVARLITGWFKAKQQYWYDVKLLCSWWLRPTAILRNNNNPWLH